MDKNTLILAIVVAVIVAVIVSIVNVYTTNNAITQLSDKVYTKQQVDSAVSNSASNVLSYVNDQVYKKADVYTKQEVDTIIKDATTNTQFDWCVADSPTSVDPNNNPILATEIDQNNEVVMWVVGKELYNGKMTCHGTYRLSTNNSLADIWAGESHNVIDVKVVPDSQFDWCIAGNYVTRISTTGNPILANEVDEDGYIGMTVIGKELYNGKMTCHGTNHLSINNALVNIWVDEFHAVVQATSGSTSNGGTTVAVTPTNVLCQMSSSGTVQGSRVTESGTLKIKNPNKMRVEVAGSVGSTNMALKVIINGGKVYMLSPSLFGSTWVSTSMTELRLAGISIPAFDQLMNLTAQETETQLTSGAIMMTGGVTPTVSCTVPSDIPDSEFQLPVGTTTKTLQQAENSRVGP